MAYRLIEAYDHSGGMNTREAPYLLNSREFADCENVTLEEAGKIKTRKGHQNYKTLPAPTGLTEISDCDDETAGGTWTEYKDVVENESFPNADQAAPPDDHDVICAAATQTDIATALGVLTIAAQPTETSRMCFCVTNDSGGPLNLYEGTTTILVEGTYDGGNQYEEIEITSDVGNKEVANGKHRYIFGAKPFSTITSITQPDYATDAMAGNLKISVAPGSLLGLPFPIEATGDVIRVTVKGAAISLAGAVSVANQTVKVGDLVDNDDVSITFRSTGEVAEGTDLSGITGVSFVALGWM